VAIFKEDECLSSNQRRKKEIESYLQSLQVLANPQLIALFELRLQQFKKGY